MDTAHSTDWADNSKAARNSSRMIAVTIIMPVVTSRADIGDFRRVTWACTGGRGGIDRHRTGQRQRCCGDHRSDQYLHANSSGRQWQLHGNRMGSVQHHRTQETGPHGSSFMQPAMAIIVYGVSGTGPTGPARPALALAAAPGAAHARHDHRAARPVFLHIGCVAYAHGVAARKIPGIDAVGSRLVTRINAQPCRRPPGYGAAPKPRRRRAEPPAPSASPAARSARWLRPRAAKKRPAKATHIAAVLIRIITPTMKLLPAATSPIAAPTSTAGAKVNSGCVRNVRRKFRKTHARRRNPR